MLNPYDRVGFRGVTLNRRTKRALLWAERRAGFSFIVTQGSYNRGGVSASAGTHDGGGAVDISVRDAQGNRLSNDEIHLIVSSLKRAGFAVWHRWTLIGVWPEHIHAICIGDEELASLAAAQVRAFDNHRDGLAGNGRDDTWRPLGGRRWSWRLNRPVLRWK